LVTQAVQAPLQCFAQHVPVDPFASGNLREGQSVDPEGTEPAALVRVQCLQHLDQPFALRIRLQASGIRKTIDQGVFCRTPVTTAALKVE
jgi:hypothetical protein|tara:strand:+ start:422 stop:691 length:270 start_codon:yes stop_codon:yes gene_type:complete